MPVLSSTIIINIIIITIIIIIIIIILNILTYHVWQISSCVQMQVDMISLRHLQKEDSIKGSLVV